jgi:hypothetical protein
VDAELDFSKLALAEGLEEEVVAELGDGAAGVRGRVGLDSGVVVDILVGGVGGGLVVVVGGGDGVRGALLPARGVRRRARRRLDGDRDGAGASSSHGGRVQPGPATITHQPPWEHD